MRDFYKGQSAIEYLTTYGWMLLVIAIVGGAIFTTVQNSAQAETVSGLTNADVQVEEFGVDDSNNLQMELRGASPDQVENVNVSIIDEESNVEVYSGDQPTISVGDTETVNIPDISRSENLNEYTINIEYDSGGLENLEADGTIRARLDIGKDSQTSEGMTGASAQSASWNYLGSDTENSFRGDGSTPSQQDITEISAGNPDSTLLATQDKIIYYNSSLAGGKLGVLNRTTKNRIWEKSATVPRMQLANQKIYGIESDSNHLNLTSYDLEDGSREIVTELYPTPSEANSRHLHVNQDDNYAFNSLGLENGSTMLNYIDTSTTGSDAIVSTRILDQDKTGRMVSTGDSIFLYTFNRSKQTGNIYKISNDSSLSVEAQSTFEGIPKLSSITASHSKIYLSTFKDFGSNGRVYAFSQQDMSKEWESTQIESPGFASGESYLYALGKKGGNDNTSVLKIDPDDGSYDYLNFDFDGAQNVFQPPITYSGGNLYVNKYADSILSVDAETMTENWQTPPTEDIYGPIIVNNGEIIHMRSIGGGGFETEMIAR